MTANITKLHVFDWRSGGEWIDPGNPLGVSIIIHIYKDFTEIIRSTTDGKGKRLDTTYMPDIPPPGAPAFEVV